MHISEKQKSSKEWPSDVASVIEEPWKTGKTKRAEEPREPTRVRGI